MINLKVNGPLDDNEKEAIESNNWIYSSSKSLSGGPEMIDVLVPIIAVAIEQLGGIIKKLIDRGKLVTIKYKDIEVKNIKPEDVDEILEELKNKTLNEQNPLDKFE